MIRHIKTTYIAATDSSGSRIHVSTMSQVDVPHLYLSFDTSKPVYLSHEHAMLKLLAANNESQGQWVGVAFDTGYRFVRLFKFTGKNRMCGDIIELGELEKGA